MPFLDNTGTQTLWNKIKATFAKTLTISGTTITLKNGADTPTALSQVTIPEATTSTPGVMSAQDKSRLDGLVASGGEPNQNAFAKVNAGGTTIEADLISDTLSIVAGDNVTVAGNSGTDTVTISAKDTTYDAATSSAAGLMTAAMVTKLAGIEDSADANQNAFSKFIVDTGVDGQSDYDYDATVESSVFKLVGGSGIRLQGGTFSETGGDSGGKITINVSADSALSASSENPVQNKVVQAAVATAQSAASSAASAASAAQSTADSAASAAAAAQSTADSKATMTEVNAAIASAQVGAAMYQGAVTSNSTISGSSYKKGWYWVVGTAGTYVGESCEAGDMIFANSDKGSAYSTSHFDVVQSNIQAMTTAEVEAICV